jgi:hypothetical protein
LQKVGEWTIPSLPCIEHNANDGLQTSTEGLQHSVLVKVPVALMDKAGEYRFVISAKDSHADREKGHRNKWALERNQGNLMPSTAQLALDETVPGSGGSINDVPWARQAYKWLSLIWNPSKRKFENGYKGWAPLGQPERGGSGVIINTWAHVAIHTLNRLHDPGHERRRWAHPNAIWGFYGHANPMVLEMPAGGYITNWANDDSTRMAYTVRNIDLSWMRLSYLAGCGTAGGCIKGRDENGHPYHCCDRCSQHPCPAAESIAQTFYDQGADAVVGWRGLLYEGDVFGKFNDWFWYLLCRKGMTVGDAVKEAKKKLPWWTRLYSDERDSVRGVKVWGGGIVIYPPRYGQ